MRRDINDKLFRRAYLRKYKFLNLFYPFFRFN